MNNQYGQDLKQLGQELWDMYNGESGTLAKEWVSMLGSPLTHDFFVKVAGWIEGDLAALDGWLSLSLLYIHFSISFIISQATLESY